MKASPATSAPANPPIAPANAPDPTSPAVLLLLEAGFTYTSYFSKNFTALNLMMELVLIYILVFLCYVVYLLFCELHIKKRVLPL